MNTEKNDEEEKDLNNQDKKIESNTGEETSEKAENLCGLEKDTTTVSKTQCVPVKSRSLPCADSCLVIDVAFDARPPNTYDVHGIRKHLQQLFVQWEYEDITELSNLVVAQNFVGCVLKHDHEEEDDNDDNDDNSQNSSDADEEEDVFAVSTVINITENKNLSCIKKINDLLITMCNENYKDEPSRMANLLGDPSEQIGLIISERFINIPPQVALPSYQSLKLDIEKAVLNNKKFDLTHLVLISKLYRIQREKEDELFFCNPEEQLFKEMSEFSYTFSVADQRGTLSDELWNEEDTDFESLRTVMVFDANALGQMIIKLHSDLSPT